MSLRGVPSGFDVSKTRRPSKPTDARDLLGKRADRQIEARAAIHRLGAVVIVEQKHRAVGEIVDVQEFAQRRACAPDHDLVAPETFASWNLRISAGSTWLVARSKLSFGP